jgi:hypothetical protein
MPDIVKDTATEAPPLLPLQGSGAIVTDAGSHAHFVPNGDDGSVGPVELGFPVNFFGKLYTSVYVNTNGNITFQGPLYKYAPFQLSAKTPPIIAPFLADVDTRGAGSGHITYGTVRFDGRIAFCVTWLSVGYHPQRADKLNSFQLLLVDRNEKGLGDFDIVMNYDRVVWESGGANGGVNGLGGLAAGAGFSAGTGDPASFLELPGSRTSGALLDSHAATGLTRTSRNSTVLGRHLFRMRRGMLAEPQLTGSLPSDREKLIARAVRLNDGRVLAVGGFNKYTDLYNPATGTWAATGDLNSVSRRHHTATLLLDGRVLIAGGEEEQPTTSVEVYEPSTGNWKLAASMLVPRVRHTATMLGDGKVLVVGGFSGSGCTPTAELYDPVRNGWSSTSGLIRPRCAHTATLLADGRVLVAGGQDSASQELSTTEVYDPRSGTWSIVGDLALPRSSHTATLLKDGRVLVTGGGTDPKVSTSAELYTPSTRTWSSTGSLSRPRRYHSALLVEGGNVIVLGGYHEYAGILREIEVYIPEAGVWSTTSSMIMDRYYAATALLKDGRILIVGGISNGDQSSAELYFPV